MIDGIRETEQTHSDSASATVTRLRPPMPDNAIIFVIADQFYTQKAKLYLPLCERQTISFPLIRDGVDSQTIVTYIER